MSLNTERNSPLVQFLGASVVLLVSALVYGQYGFNGELVRDDATNRATYELRLAKMYHSANRPDLARPILESLDKEARG